MKYFLKSLEKVLKFRCQDGVATLIELLPLENITDVYDIEDNDECRNIMAVAYNIITYSPFSAAHRTPSS